MKVMDDLKEILEDELKKITKKGDISPQELEGAYKAIDIIKDLETIKAMSEYGQDYSQMNGQQSHNSYNRGSYDYSNRGSYNSYGPVWNQSNVPYSREMSHNSYNSYDGSYNSYDGRAGRDADNDGRYSEDNYSNARGRDARGRYTSRDGSYDYSRDYSREYSRHSEKELMIQKLETMADVTTDPKIKSAIDECITKMGK